MLESLNCYRIASGDGYCRLTATCRRAAQDVRRQRYRLVLCWTLISSGLTADWRLASMPDPDIVDITPSHHHTILGIEGTGDGGHRRIPEPTRSI